MRYEVGAWVSDAARAVNGPRSLVWYLGPKDGVLIVLLEVCWEMGVVLLVTARMTPTRAVVVKEYFILKALLGE